MFYSEITKDLVTVFKSKDDEIVKLEIEPEEVPESSVQDG